jgi:uncharacterized protein YjdB
VLKSDILYKKYFGSKKFMKKQIILSIIPFMLSACMVDVNQTKVTTDGKTDTSSSSAPVKLKDLPVKEVRITSGDDLVITEQNKIQVSANVIYSDNSVDSNVKWSSSDNTVATVNADNGNVSGIKDGTTTIIATSMKDPSKRSSVRITVRRAPVEELKASITLNGNKITELNLQEEQTEVLQATIKLSDGTVSPNVTWKSSDSTVVNVRNGSLTALKNGVATITAIADGDSTKQASVKVTVGNVAPAPTPAATVAPTPVPTVAPTATPTVAPTATVTPAQS